MRVTFLSPGQSPNSSDTVSMIEEVEQSSLNVGNSNGMSSSHESTVSAGNVVKTGAILSVTMTVFVAVLEFPQASVATYVKVDIAWPKQVPSGKYEIEDVTVKSLQSSIISGGSFTRSPPHSANTVSALNTI